MDSNNKTKERRKHPLYNHSGLVKNTKPQVMYALVNKRIEIKRKIKVDSFEIERLKKQLNSLEETICLFDPEFGAEMLNTTTYINTNRTKSSYFKVGDMPRICLDVIKKSDKEMSSLEITDYIINIQLINREDSKARREIVKGVTRALRKLEKDHIVKCTSPSPKNRPLYWKYIDN